MDPVFSGRYIAPAEIHFHPRPKKRDHLSAQGGKSARPLLLGKTSVRRYAYSVRHWRESALDVGLRMG